MATSSYVLATRDTKPYYKAYNASNDLPADNAYGTAWSGYTDLGYTDGGMTASMSRDVSEITVDQLFDVVLFVPTARDIRFTTNLAEINPLTMPMATGMGSTATVAAGAGTRGHDEFVVTGAIPANVYYTFGFEALEQSGEAARALFNKCLPVSAFELNVGVADTKATIPLEARALPQASASDDVFTWRHILAAL